MANRRTGKVTCSAVKKNGERCKQTVGLIDGVCSSHRKAVVVDKKVVKVAQPEFGADHLKNLIDATVAPEIGDGKTKLEFVNGQWTEVPVEEERPVKQAREYFEAKDAVGRVERTGELVDPSDIFTKHAYLMKYVALDAVVNKHIFSAYVRNMAGMNYLQCAQEFKFLKDEEDTLSAEAKQVREEAHHEYGRNIPEDIQTVLNLLIAEITALKNKRAVVMAALEWYEEQEAKEEENWNGMDKSWEEKDHSMMDSIKGFFVGLWTKASKVTAKSLLIAGVLMVLASVSMMFNMGDKEVPVTPVHHNTVTEHHSKPVVKSKPVAEHKPAVVVKAHQNVSPVVTYTVKSGDTLWSIAVHVYGDGSKWTKLYDANKSKLMHDDVRNVADGGHWIHAGQVINVPGGE